MNEDQLAGTAKRVGGRIEEAVGVIANDRDLRADGIVDQVRGAAQNLYGDAKEKVRDTLDHMAPVTRKRIAKAATVTRENSLFVVLAAGAVGFALAIAFRNSGEPTRDSWSA